MFQLPATKRDQDRLIAALRGEVDPHPRSGQTTRLLTAQREFENLLAAIRTEPVPFPNEKRDHSPTARFIERVHAAFRNEPEPVFGGGDYGGIDVQSLTVTEFGVTAVTITPGA